MLSMAVAPSYFKGNTVRCVLPVMWMTLCFHIMERMVQNQIRRVCFVQFAWWLHRGQSLPSPTAPCCIIAS